MYFPSPRKQDYFRVHPSLPLGCLKLTSQFDGKHNNRIG